MTRHSNNYLWCIFGIIGLFTAVSSGMTYADLAPVVTPVPLFSFIQLPFKSANVQSCAVDGTVKIFLNSPRTMVMGLESKRGLIKEVFRDQTLDQSDAVFGCKKNSDNTYNYVYLNDQGLFAVNNGQKQSVVGVYTKLILSKSANDIWAIAKGASDAYYWLAIRETIDLLAQTSLPGDCFAVNSIYNHASIASIQTNNYTSKTIQYLTYDIDNNLMMDNSVESFLPLNPAPNLKLFELQKNWICATEKLLEVTRLTTVSSEAPTAFYDSYEGADYLDVVFLGSNYEIAVVAVGTSIDQPNYNIILYLWDINSSSSDYNGNYVIDTRKVDEVPDPANIRDFISLARIDDNTAQLTYVLNGTLYGYLIGLNGSVPVDSISDVELTIDTLVVVSTLDLNSNSSIIFQEGGIINVAGCATFDGTLVLLLSNQTIDALRNSSVTIDIATYACYDGQFTSIGVNGDPDLQDCEKLVGKPNYNPSILSITVIVDSSQCNQIGLTPNTAVPGFNVTGLIIGVVLGGCVLVVGILLLAFYFSPLRKRVFPYARSGTKK